MNAGDEIRSQYTLKKEIGSGNYGDVWLAEKQMGFGSGRIEYALKFLRSKDEKGVDIEKVRREIATWTKASSHINIISIHDSFIDHGRYVIVSDYADGGSLKGKIFSFEQSIKIIEGVLNGLEHLHKLPIIHRDIKPENILLKNGIACITDFGLARDFDNTQSTGLAGSINYFSPEMAKKEIDNIEHKRTPLDDLWSTAVTFYQLITNNLPFKTLGNISKCQREPLPPNFPIELIEFFDTAFHKNPQGRFQSATEMREKLQQTLSPEIKYQAELERLKTERTDLQNKLKDTQISTRKLNYLLAEAQLKVEQLAEEKTAIEKKSVIEIQNLKKLHTEIGALQNKLQSSRKFGEEKSVENVRVKQQLQELETQLRQLQIEKQETDKNKALLTAEIEDKNEVVQQIVGELENEEMSESPASAANASDSAAQTIQNSSEAEMFFDSGSAYQIRGEHHQAVEYYTKAIELKSDYKDAYFGRGYSYYEKGNRDRAIEDYSKVIELSPSEPRAYNNRGIAYEEQGNFAQALIDYNKVIEIDPNYADAYNNRGFAYYNQGNYDLAIADYKKAIEIDPNVTHARENLKLALQAKQKPAGSPGIVESAFGILALIGVIVPIYLLAYPVASYSSNVLNHNVFGSGQTAEMITFTIIMLAAMLIMVILVMRIVIYIIDFSESLNFLLTSISFIAGAVTCVYFAYCLLLMPNYHQMASVCWQEKNYDCAIENYTNIIYWHPRYWLTGETDAFYKRGNAYRAKLDYDRAIRDYTKVIELSPGNEFAFIWRGFSEAAKENYDRAVVDYDKAIELKPDNELVYRLRAGAYKSQNKYDEAIADYSKSIEIKQDADSYYYRGKVFNVKGDSEQAVKDYTKAIELKSDYADAYYSRAEIYKNKNNYDQAVKDYTKAIELNPDYQFAYFGRGYSYLEKRLFDQAIKDYTRVIELNPSDPGAYNNRGIAYQNKKNYVQAIVDYNKAIEINPSFADAYNNRGIVYYNKGDYDLAIRDYRKAIEIDPKAKHARENLKLVLQAKEKQNLR
jgi:tetratricopeptide (TPR) repeat protein